MKPQTAIGALQCGAYGVGKHLTPALEWAWDKYFERFPDRMINSVVRKCFKMITGTTPERLKKTLGGPCQKS